PDPGQTRQGLQGRADREADLLRGLITGWKELRPGPEGGTVADALNLLGAPAAHGKYATLRQVLAEAFDLPPGALPTSRKLGNLLRRFAGRNVGGFCLESQAAHAGVKRWRVQEVRQGGGCGGCGGSAPADPGAGAGGGDPRAAGAGGEKRP